MVAVGQTGTIGTGVPAGGASQQWLVRQSSGAVAWSSGVAAGLELIYPQSGLWYDTRVPVNGQSSVVLTSSLSSGAVYYLANWLPAAVTIDMIGVGAKASTAGGLMYAGASLMDPSTVKPTTLLASGSVSVTVTTATVYQIPVSCTLPQGWSFLALGVTNSTWQAQGGGTAAVRPLPYPLASWNNFLNYVGWKATAVGGIPASNPTVALVDSTQSQSYSFPIGFRCA